MEENGSYALWFSVGEGLYTDMNAIRRDEDLDNLHSIYVDQWDWEMVISKRTGTLIHKNTVKRYLEFSKDTGLYSWQYPELPRFVPEISLCNHTGVGRHVSRSYPEGEETVFSRAHGAACIMQIGDKLKSGKPHDGRAPDYDDWSLNCDIIFYYPVLDTAFEVSSMESASMRNPCFPS